MGFTSAERSPWYMEVYGRQVHMKETQPKNRWFDMPLSAEESTKSLADGNMITVKFGPSSDPHGVSIVDSIKVYTKTKDEFTAGKSSKDSPSKPRQGTVSSLSSSTKLLAPAMSATFSKSAGCASSLVTSLLDVANNCIIHAIVGNIQKGCH